MELSSSVLRDFEFLKHDIDSSILSVLNFWIYFLQLTDSNKENVLMLYVSSAVHAILPRNIA